MKDQQPKKADESNLTKLRLPQNFDSIIGGQKLTQQLSVKKPEKQWFVRTHPNGDMWFNAAVLEFQEDRQTYIVESDLWNELANEIVPKVLIPSMTTHGHPLLWPIKMPSEDGHIDDWNRSALLAAQLAQEKWVRVISNRSLGSYETLVAATIYPDPSWPDYDMEEWLRLGFRDRIIGSLDHPVVQRLRGEL